MLLLNPWTYWCLFVWLFCSWCVMDFIAEIHPSERKLSRKLWMRWLLVIIGPLPATACIICYTGDKLWNKINDMVPRMPRTLQAFLREPPELSDAAIIDAAGAEAEQRMVKQGGFGPID
jgi:hypothetical protein